MIAALVLPRDAARLSTGERLCLASEILHAYVLVRWWLRRSGVEETLSAARRRPGSALEPYGDISLATAFRLAQGVQRTLGVLPLDSRCLIRSLVLTRILARRGITSTVVFAARTRPRFVAHSWVEHAGVPLLPTGSDLHRLREL